MGKTVKKDPTRRDKAKRRLKIYSKDKYRNIRIFEDDLLDDYFDEEEEEVLSYGNKH